MFSPYSFHIRCQATYLQNWTVGISEHNLTEWEVDYRTEGLLLMLWNRHTKIESTVNETFFFFALFLQSLLPYFIPGSARWWSPLWVCEWETLGVSLLRLIRSGQRFRSPASPSIIISSHSFSVVNPIPLLWLQRLLSQNKVCRQKIVTCLD